MTRQFPLLLSLALALVLAAAPSLPVLSAPPAPQAAGTRDVCPVPGSCYTSIQAAVDASLPGDVVRVAGGPGVVYTEMLSISKSVNILGGYSGPFGVTPWQRNLGVYTTTVDSGGLGTVVTFVSGAALLEGFTITGGAAGDGGGIAIRAASPVISATRIVSNTAGSSGGGIFMDGGAPLIVRNTIAYNSAAGGGGGLLIANGAQPQILDTVISHNRTGFGAGGGIFVVGGASLTLSGGSIDSNSGSLGGGVAIADSTASLSNTLIRQNRAESGFGGGISAGGSLLTLEASAVLSNTASVDGGGMQIDASSPVVRHSTFSGNSAPNGGGVSFSNSLGLFSDNTVTRNAATGDRGGGIAVDHAGPSLSANTISHNSAAARGGGIAITGAYCSADPCIDALSATVVNNVLSHNSAATGGAGIYIDTGSNPGVVNNTITANLGDGVLIEAYGQAAVVNNIITGNTTGLAARVPSAPSADYNLVRGNAPGGNYSGLAAGPHDVIGDPLFASPATEDYHLLPESSALDAASALAAPANDRDGNARPLAGRCGSQPRPDIGAYEFVLPANSCLTPTVTATSTTTATPSRTATPTATATVPGCPDVYEPDDSQAQAKGIAVGAAPQRHNVHLSGNADWVSFSATAGVTYTIWTLNLTGGTDTFIELWNATSKIAQNDDDPGRGLASRIEWLASVGGTYFVKVYDPYQTAGCATGYDLQVVVTGTPAGTPTATRTRTATATPTRTATPGTPTATRTSTASTKPYRLFLPVITATFQPDGQ